MKRLIRVLLCAFVLSGLALNTAGAQDKLAQTGMKFLAVSADARAAAMGEAFTAVEGTSQAMFFNPAGIARVNGNGMVAFGQTMWIADIKHNFGSVAFSPFGGEYGVLGVSVQTVNYGSLDGTIVDGTTAKGIRISGPSRRKPSQSALVTPARSAASSRSASP